jgi:hypothetical protein
MRSNRITQRQSLAAHCAVDRRIALSLMRSHASRAAVKRMQQLAHGQAVIDVCNMTDAHGPTQLQLATVPRCAAAQ